MTNFNNRTIIYQFSLGVRLRKLCSSAGPKNRLIFDIHFCGESSLAAKYFDVSLKFTSSINSKCDMIIARHSSGRASASKSISSARKIRLVQIPHVLYLTRIIFHCHSLTELKKWRRFLFQFSCELSPEFSANYFCGPQASDYYSVGSATIPRHIWILLNHYWMRWSQIICFEESTHDRTMKSRYLLVLLAITACINQVNIFNIYIGSAKSIWILIDLFFLWWLFCMQGKLQLWFGILVTLFLVYKSN